MMNRREPVAVIGIGCRFPGASTPQDYWKLLSSGVDALKEIPEDRWDLRSFYDPRPSIPGKTNIRFGGFVEGIDQFDPEFFGISPREASRMDPQQRMLLEVAWEALEDGGQVLDHLAGGSTGVFVGVSSWDYTMIQAGYRDRNAVDVYTNTGGALSIAANRISYCYDFKGPSMAIDTACSSGLTAVHLACRSIWDGDCELALAGAANLLITPGPYLGFSMLSMLSPDGRCKAFDSRANGFVRSEGAGMVLLKPLAAAIADGDPIYAVIRGTAINQDGSTTGLTVPSQTSQRDLIKEACRNAGVQPRQVQFVEAHGTGTLVGDPIEARALGEALSKDRDPGDVCYLGSVKTNIGHLESAAGIAGLIKTALALKHQLIPANLHFQSPNPDIDFDALHLQVPTENIPWESRDGARLAGVNSFGFGGSNAHVILEGYVHDRPSNGKVLPIYSKSMTAKPNGSDKSHSNGSIKHDSLPNGMTLIPISARSTNAVKALASAYAKLLREQPECWQDFLYTTRRRRTNHEYRSVFMAATPEELVLRLDDFVEGNRQDFVVSDRVMPGRKQELVFVFSGQGPQWFAMGRELMRDEPVFAEAIRECDAWLKKLGSDWSLEAELHAEEVDSRMGDTIAQPAICALQIGLARLWKSRGIVPNAIIGHSVGEIAASHVAGVLTLEDAMRVIYHRGRCMSLASKEGGMLAVGMTVADAEQRIAKYQGSITIAAMNGPQSQTLSGDLSQLQLLADELEKDRIFCKFLRVNQAFHSHHMDPAKPEILKWLADVQPDAAQIPLISTVTADYVGGPEQSAEYWWNNIRQSVRFADGTRKLLEQGYELFVELSPHPVLDSAVTECALDRNKKVKVVASLRRKEPEKATMLRAFGHLFCLGFPIQWDRVAIDSGHLMQLPTYPWQKDTYWHEAEESRENRLGMLGRHPLLGRSLKNSIPLWQSHISLNHLPYLVDHQVQGHVLVPGTAMLEMAMAAGKETFGTGPYFLEDVKLAKAIFLNPGTERVAQTSYDASNATFQIRTGVAEPNCSWTLHCSGQLRSRSEDPPATAWNWDLVRERCGMVLEQEDCYRLFKQQDIKYGPNFQGMKRLWLGEGEALGEIVAPAEIAATIADYQFHPAILDACLQCVFGAIPLARMKEPGSGVFLPVEMEQVRVYGAAASELRVHSRLQQIDAQGITVQLQVYDLNGALLVDIQGLRCQYVGMHGGTADSLNDLVYSFKWKLAPLQKSQVEGGLEGSIGLQEMAGSLEGHSISLSSDSVKEVRSRLVSGLNRLAAIYIVEALARLGFTFNAGSSFEESELLAKHKIVNQHQRVFHRYLMMLEEEGIIREAHGKWEVLVTPTFESSHDCWQGLLLENPAFYAELTMIRRCAGQLDKVLLGELNPLQLIFPEGSLDTAEHLYQDSPSVRVYNTLARQAIVKMIEDLPEDRMIRILEIGAGTGGLTSYILPFLPPDRTQYVFTDLSNHFFNKGKQKFSDYSFLEYRLLDIEKSPLEQGYTPDSFDIVIASQVLHATKDLNQTLDHVHTLLSNHGVLVMLELMKPARWIDLVFGLTEGWWHFSDHALRPDYPLLPFDKWKTLLHSIGFSETVNVADGQQVEGFGSAVIVSRTTSKTAAIPSIPARPLEESDSSSPSTESEHAAAQDLSGEWLIFADRQGHGETLAAALKEQGGNCTLVFAGEHYQKIEDGRVELSATRLDDFLTLLQDFTGKPTPRILHLWNLDQPRTTELNPSNLLDAHDLGCMSVIHLFQAWSKTLRASSSIGILTRRALSVHCDGTIEPIELAQTNVWGLSRVLFNEYSKLRGKMIDLGSHHPHEVDSIIAELKSNSDEDEVALRGNARYVNRYLSNPLWDRTQLSSDKDPNVAYRLESATAGVLDGLVFREQPRHTMQEHAVEIEVHATALNFSDVMKALGLYPGLPDGPVPLGIECAGRITAVGPGVTEFQVGDDVLALAQFSFGSHAVTHASLVAPMPKHLTYEEAATLPIAFLTAEYSLVELGRLQPGERVLIHSAAGGVGLAAIQVAKQIGAEVFVTAGSAEKREFLKSLGVEHVMDSRSLKFVDQIMEITNGQGVDVVLNSLSGEAISKTLTVLGDYGRFLEIGKRDIYMNSPLGMRGFKKNVSFIAIDLDRVMRQRPQMLGKLFRETIDRVRQTHYQPLPHRVFSATNIKSAFRYMAQAKHIGKVVVSFEDSPVKILPAPPKPMQLAEDGTYFISGGLGGFGLLVARWMVEQGAKNFVLMGRRGIHSPDSQAGVDALQQLGAKVLVVKGDVSNPRDVERAFAEAAHLPPIRGVLHAAMHLEDCLLNQLDRAAMLRVVEPKMLGVWNLHQQTLNMPLDFFVSFSSMGSVFGMPGQANYAAGNLFLDTLPFYRRSQGMSGLTINWGYLREVGYVAERADLVERFESQGFKGISPREALAVLGKLMTQSPPQVSVVRMDWSRARDLGLSSLIAPRFSELTDRVSSQSGQDNLAIRRALLAVPHEKRKPILVAALQEKVATVLGASPDKVDLDTPLTDVGVDSLMAVELRNWVEGELRVNLPIVELMEGPSVNRLADLLLEQLQKGEMRSGGADSTSSSPAVTAADTSTKPAESTTDVVEQVSELSDADVDAMLNEMLESKGST